MSKYLIRCIDDRGSTKYLKMGEDYIGECDTKYCIIKYDREEALSKGIKSRALSRRFNRSRFVILKRLQEVRDGVK